MPEKSGESKKIVNERRMENDRRTGKLDGKFNYSVEMGFFLDARKSERRKKSQDHIISLN